MKKIKDMDMQELRREKLVYSVSTFSGVIAFAVIFSVSLLLFTSSAVSVLRPINLAVVSQTIIPPLDVPSIFGLIMATMVLAFTGFQFTMLTRVIMEIRLREIVVELKK